MGNKNNLINNFKGNKAVNIIEVPKKEVNIIINNNNNKIVNFKEKNNALKDELRIEKENNNKLIKKLKKYETQIINGQNQFKKSLEKINELNCKIEALNNKLNTNKYFR
jgi:predicted RNase H-like nuclease (RuvC/YqgF family)